jgi:glycosyltransferase involved in cell wall biosynthesis
MNTIILSNNKIESQNGISVGPFSSGLPLVSIITVVLNGENHLEQTILSVLNQSYINIQYIIIDGGSKDGTINIINKYATKLSNWISEKDSGIADAFNKGIKLSSGELVGIINCGDYYEKEAVQNVVNAYLLNKDRVFHGNVMNIYETKSEIAKPKIEDIWKRMSLIHATMFIPKIIYDKYGLFDGTYKYAMDCEYVHRIISAGVNFVYLNKTISNFRIGGKSDSNTNYEKAIKEFWRSVNKYKGGSILNIYYMYIMIFKRKYRGSLLHSSHKLFRGLFKRLITC